jgi:L-asparaginase II
VDATNGTDGGPRLGSWARSGGLVGLVAAVDGDEIALFDPGERQLARVPRSAVESVPAGAVTMTVTIDLPVPHGVDESSLRRWAASLTDLALRDRAAQALTDHGLDPGAALPDARVSVRAMESGAVCLCGAKVPAPDGARLPCPACGREAVGPPLRTH